MPLYSNYNMLAIPPDDSMYKIGDIFNCPAVCWYKYGRFHGLKIINIDYCFAKRLWFDWSEWANNKRSPNETGQTPFNKLNHEHTHNI